MEISTLDKYILPDVLNCPIPKVREAVRRAATDFCAKTRQVYLEKTSSLTPTDVPGGVYTEDYTLPDDTDIHTVWRTEINGAPWTPQRATGETLVVSNSLVYVVDSPQITYVGLPQDQDFDLKTVLVLVPTATATTLPDILTRWREEIVSGAKYWLLMERNAQWYAPDLAAVHRRKFNAGVGRALYQLASGFGTISPRVAPRRFV